MHRCIFLCFAAASALVSATAVAQVPFSIQGPGVDPSHFKMTTFATGLNYPVGMVELPDGSIAVATSNSSSFFGTTSGSIIRLADTNGDGVSDSTTTLVGNVQGGKISALRRAGDLLFITGQGDGTPISIYRLGATPTSPLSLQGTLTLNYPGGGWLHPHSALSVRETPGSSGSYDLVFQLGSDTNYAVTTRTVNLSSSAGIGVSGSLAGDALHMVTITDNGNSVTGSNLRQIATGLRNPAGHFFHPVSGDLILQDNGIDGFVSAIEPESADELNRISASDIGGSLEDFGFPFNYTQYRTNAIIGGGGIQPEFAFQPIPMPNGDEGEGPNDVVYAPPAFPVAIRNGAFVGMHGQFSRGGTNNEENPLVFANFDNNDYFHFVGNDESAVGHLDGLLATKDTLFIADISPSGGFGNSSRNSGKIYRLESLLATCDLNSDNAVDAADVSPIFSAWASSDTLADLNRDGTVDAADASICFTEWTGDASGVVAAVIPEPTGISLVASAMCCLALAGWRRSR